METLGPLPETSSSNPYVLEFTTWYTNQSMVIPTISVTSTYATSVLVAHWVIRYGASTHLLTNEAHQLVCKFFPAVCEYLLAILLTATAYCFQTNGQVEQLNKTTVTRLCDYVTDHETDLDPFAQPLTSVYNGQGHPSTETTPFSFVLRPHPQVQQYQICHFRYPQICRHNPNTAYFASAFCKNSPCSEYVPTEHWETLKFLICATLISQLAALQYSDRDDTYLSTISLNSSLQ